MLGKTISHYQVVEKLGAGGMGEIYKAQDTRLNRFVAIKALTRMDAGDTDRRRRFIQEAQAASSLNHPNIITIYDIVSEGGDEFMVMEFVNGRTLGNLLPPGGLSVSEALSDAIQIADALQAAHAAGIVHRDLKPANILLRLTAGLVWLISDWREPCSTTRLWTWRAGNWREPRPICRQQLRQATPKTRAVTFIPLAHCFTKC